MAKNYQIIEDGAKSKKKNITAVEKVLFADGEHVIEIPLFLVVL